MEIEDHMKVEDVLLYYKKIQVDDHEDSETLIFLHDALGSTAQWKDFPRLLSLKTGLNAIVFDRQGYGKSGPASNVRTKDYLSQEAEVVLPAFLKKLEIEKPVLFGHSDGGSIALLYASVFKPLAIVCEAAHVLVEEETTRGIRKAFSQRAFLIEKLIKYHGDKAEILFDSWQNIWLDADFQNWNIEEDLKKIDCPALILQGQNDEYATKEHLDKIKKGIGDNAQSVLIKDCGHIPHLEAQEEVLEKTTKFLQTFL